MYGNEANISYPHPKRRAQSIYSTHSSSTRWVLSFPSVIYLLFNELPCAADAGPCTVYTAHASLGTMMTYILHYIIYIRCGDGTQTNIMFHRAIVHSHTDANRTA